MSSRTEALKEARKLERLADDKDRQAFALDGWARDAALAGDFARMARESDEALRMARAADRCREQAATLRQK